MVYVADFDEHIYLECLKWVYNHVEYNNGQNCGLGLFKNMYLLYLKNGVKKS